ncbi:MAG: hypothetical protein ACI4QE_04160, partial [Acutalibacteraceae bacterium]
NNNTYNTQVIYYEAQEKALKNPLFEKRTGGILLTEHSTAISSRDFDGDGTIELPTDRLLPVEENSTKGAVEVTWNEINLESSILMSEGSYIENRKYGFSFLVPNDWNREYTAIYNNSGDTLTFYRATGVNGKAPQIGHKLFSIKVFKNSENSVLKKEGYFEITADNNYTYGYIVDKKTPYIITENLVNTNFSLLKDKNDNTKSSDK